MQFRSRFASHQVCTFLILGLLSFAVLWKGGKSLEATWLLAGVAALITLISHWREREAKEWQGIPLTLWWGVMVFTVWTVASYLQSSAQNYGLDEVLRTVAFALLFLWIIRFSQQEDGRAYGRFIERLVRTVGILTVAACAVGFLVYVFQPVNRFVGTFFDYRFHTDYWPNAWADYLLLAWPLVYYWCFRAWEYRSMSKRTLAEVLCRSFTVSMVIGALLLSYSRGALMVFTGQLALWFILYYLGAREDFPKKKIAVLVLIIGVFSTSIFFGVNATRSNVYEVQSVAEKVTLTSDEGASSVTERVQFWHQAAALARSRPLFGWGPYSFRFVQPRMQDSVLATSDHPHNIFLKYAAERGIPAAILFAVIVAYVLLRGAKNEITRERESAHHSSLGIVFFVSLAGLLAHNLLDFNLQFVGIALLFWLLLGLLAGRVPYESTRKLNTNAARGVELVLAALLLLTAGIEGGYLAVSSLGRHAEARGDTKTALVWYERARGEWFSRDLHLSRAKIFSESGSSENARKALQDYFIQNRQDSRAWKRLGEIEFSEGHLEEALAAYMQAYEYGRYNDVGILAGLVQILLIQNRQEELLGRRAEFDDLLQRFGNAIVQNTHFIALSPNVELFVELSDRFAKMYPNEAPLYVVVAARADHNSKLERQRTAARPPGFLW